MPEGVCELLFNEVLVAAIDSYLLNPKRRIRNNIME